jgi:hypothetical protein
MSLTTPALSFVGHWRLDRFFRLCQPDWVAPNEFERTLDDAVIAIRKRRYFPRHFRSRHDKDAVGISFASGQQILRLAS